MAYPDPWITLPHVTLAGAALTLSTTALALHWSTSGTDLASTVLWLSALLLRSALTGDSLIFEHRRERWQIRTIAETTAAQLVAMEDRLSALSRSGLIAMHRVRGRDR